MAKPLAGAQSEKGRSKAPLGVWHEALSESAYKPYPNFTRSRLASRKTPLRVDLVTGLAPGQLPPVTSLHLLKPLFRVGPMCVTAGALLL
jgi:hypothetical protein